MPTISGLASGIDTDAIVEELLKIRKTRIDVLTAQKKEVTSQQAAFKLIEADIIVAARPGEHAVAIAEQRLRFAEGHAARTKTLSSATATSRAAAGVYQIKVNFARPGAPGRFAGLCRGRLADHAGDVRTEGWLQRQRDDHHRRYEQHAAGAGRCDHRRRDRRLGRDRSGRLESVGAVQAAADVEQDGRREPDHGDE